jgi:hypothetical protein
MRIYKLLIAVLVPLLIASGVAYAQIGGGVGWFDIVQDVRIHGDLQVDDDATFTDQVNSVDVTASDDVTAGDDVVSTDDVTVGDDLVVTDDATFGDTITQALNEENVGMLPTVASVAITTTDKTAFTIQDGETWIVHDVIIKVTTNYACTGDDCGMLVGDSGDADGFLVLVDANLQAADTEYTGAQAGWQGLAAATRGVYLDEVTTNAYHAHVYIASGSAKTILVDVTGTDITTGAATLYIIYTRIA